MLKIDLTEIVRLVKRLKNRGKIKNIQRNAFLNMLDRITAKTKKYHRFTNRTFLLQNSVEYYIQGNIGFIVSNDVEYNDYIYSGSDKYNTSWAPDPWIKDTWDSEKGLELGLFRDEVVEGLDGYLT
jgi:hypothetical protein